MAGELGFEPRLTESEVRCSTVELFPIFSLDIASLYQLVLQFGQAVLQMRGRGA